MIVSLILSVLLSSMVDGASLITPRVNLTDYVTTCTTNKFGRPCIDRQPVGHDVNTLTLQWNYAGPISNIIFNVYATNNLAIKLNKWPRIGQTTNLFYTVTNNHNQQWFIVKAMDITWLTESQPATK